MEICIFCSLEMLTLYWKHFILSEESKKLLTDEISIYIIIDYLKPQIADSRAGIWEQQQHRPAITQ